MEKQKNKYEKVIIIAVIFIIIASMTACGKLQNKTNEVTSEEFTKANTATTPIITTQTATTQATTNQVYTTETNTTITAATITTTALKATTTTKPTTTKTTAPKETTTQRETTTLEELTTQREMTTRKEQTTQKETTTKKAVSTEYDRLLSKLKKELKQKTFDEEVNMLFFELFDQLYENYPTWQQGYRDLPSREKYITENLINVIEKIIFIEFYEEGSKEANKLDEKGYSSAWTSFDEDRNLKVGIIAKKSANADIEERTNAIECFFHEIIHCKQSFLMDYENDYFKDNEEVEALYLEGGATFHMKFTKPFDLIVGGIWSVENEQGDLTINYGKDNCSGYLVDLNAYEKLVYLVGYNMIDKIEKGELPISAVKNSIAEKYGEQQASEFINTMKDWYVEYQNNYKGERIFNLALELENQFLNFIKQDIESLETQIDAENYKQTYDFYMLRNLPRIENESIQPHKDLTMEFYDIETLDKMLEEKLY